MAKYLKNGSAWRVSSDADADYRPALPAGNYVVKRDQLGNYYLEESEPFAVGRVYGDAARTADRILRTYLDRGRNTGVLAVGAKGTGKTLLSRLVACLAADRHGIPTILVNEPFGGDGFNTFLAAVTQKAVVLFDEFEKTYRGDGDDDDPSNAAQDALLTLLDGVYQMDKLFLMTANDEYAVSRHMISRPGRIFYYLEFGPLDRPFVEEYCREHLADRSQVGMVANVAELYGNFSFDVLKALCEEMNRYGEGPRAAMKYLNVRMDRWGRDRDYELVVTRAGVPCQIPCYEDRTYSIDPTETDFTLEVYDGEVDVNDNGDDRKRKRISLAIRPDRIVGMKDGGKVILYRDKGHEVTATMLPPMKFDPFDSLAAGYDEAGPVPARRPGRNGKPVHTGRA